MLSLNSKCFRDAGSDMDREFSADYWRNKAEEARAMAAKLTRDENRRAMLRIAQTHGRMAERAEAREKPSR